MFVKTEPSYYSRHLSIGKASLLSMTNTVKLEMFADINVCEFVILEVFALLKLANLGLSKVNFLFPTNSVLLLLLEIGYILDD